MDIRWSKDHIPFVHHDPNTGRLFKTDLTLKDHTAEHIRRTLPEIPRLDEIIAAYGGRMHLMIEIKEPLTRDRVQILRDLMSELRPQKDYHLLALDPVLFRGIDFVPRGAFLPVAETNTAPLSKTALEEGLGGITGHYLLLTQPYLTTHRDQNQRVGTGFVTSRNALAREIEREVEWIFTNHALQVRSHLDELIGITDSNQ